MAEAKKDPTEPDTASDADATIHGGFKVIVFLGSARDAPPSWNPAGPQRLGDRVLKFFTERVTARSAELQFDFEVLDTLAIPEFQTVMTNPTYFKDAKDVPQALKDIGTRIKDADAYVIITPEYNHTIPSALTNMMNQ